VGAEPVHGEPWFPGNRERQFLQKVTANYREYRPQPC